MNLWDDLQGNRKQTKKEKRGEGYYTQSPTKSHTCAQNLRSTSMNTDQLFIKLIHSYKYVLSDRKIKQIESPNLQYFKINNFLSILPRIKLKASNFRNKKSDNQNGVDNTITNSFKKLSAVRPDISFKNLSHLNTTNRITKPAVFQDL